MRAAACANNTVAAGFCTVEVIRHCGSFSTMSITCLLCLYANRPTLRHGRCTYYFPARKMLARAWVALSFASTACNLAWDVHFDWGLFEQLFGWISVVAFPDFDVPGVNEGPLLLFALVVLQTGLFVGVLSYVLMPEHGWGDDMMRRMLARVPPRKRKKRRKERS